MIEAPAARYDRDFENVRSLPYAVEHEESALQATCIGLLVINKAGRAGRP